MALRNYSTEPGLLKLVLELLEVAFGDWLRPQVVLARRWGLRWEDCSVPFVSVVGGQVVAHLGVMTIPVVLDAAHTTVGALHAAAVHPEHRGRGHLRRLMHEVLAWCDSRYTTCALAGAPELYERFGFRHVPEHRFVGPAPAAASGSRLPLRVCEVSDPVDLALWKRLLHERAAVSERAAILQDPHVFCFNAVHLGVRYAAQLDALLDYTCEDGTLRLYDVVAPRMPSLVELVSAVPETVEWVEVYFAPDRLAADLEPQPHDLGPPGDPDTWMVRGPWTEAPFMWPRTARW